MPKTAVKEWNAQSRLLGWFLGRARTRRCGIGASVTFVLAGSLYFFAWGPTVQHLPYWITPGDLWLTFDTAGRIAHGHLSTMYIHRVYHVGSFRFVDFITTFPGIVVTLTPVAALASALHLSADVPPYAFAHPLAHPQAWLLLGPFVLILGTIPILACDALAEWLGADVPRRLLLGMAEAVALWNVVVLWGHPEDAVAIGLMIYAFLFALKNRWSGAGWLFGVSLAFQPLAVLALPVFLAVAGTKRWPALIVKGALPSIVLLIGPLITNFHATWLVQTKQLNFPTFNHETPWTALAPRVRGLGQFAVQSGPGRLVSIVLACGVGWWVWRRRDRPDIVMWSVALALALRSLTESVMDPYYLWPALAVAMVASVRTEWWRFSGTLIAAILVTVTSQWNLGWLTWWTLNIGVLIVALASAAPLGVTDATASRPASSTVRRGTPTRQRPTAARGRPARR